MQLLQWDQVATCKEMLISGVGVTILPEIMMKNISKEQFEFEKVEIDNEPLIRSTFMSYKCEHVAIATS